MDNEAQVSQPENTGKMQETRDKSGRYKPGVSGNPKGKPKGAKNKFSFIKYWQERWEKDPEEFERLATEFMKDDNLRALIIQMVDGRPHQTSDLTSDGKPLPILNVISANNGNEQNSKPDQED